MKKTIMVLVSLFALVFVISGCDIIDINGSDTAKYTSVLSIEDIFSSEDLEQSVDTSSATKYTISDDQDVSITEEGLFVIEGSSSNTSIIIDALDDETVHLVLNNVTIKNTNKPCIYVKNAKKVIVTTTGTNSFKVTSKFSSDENTKTDAVIYSKDDLVLNGTGSLAIDSSDNGITSKDDLKITGGIISINCSSDALEANNSIAIKDGTVTISSKKDGIHSEYSEDDSKGYVYIGGGIVTISASDDAIHATTVVQIDGGTITLDGREGIEGTYVQINGGTITIAATDDGINGARQSKSYTATIEFNGGHTLIDMGNGDTDAVDSNGNLYINGGTIEINAQNTFDYDGTGEYNGGKIIVNGEETNKLTNQTMGGPPGGK